MSPTSQRTHFQTQLAVVRALADSSTLREAFARIIEAICETAKWEWGALWQVDGAQDTLCCAAVWHLPEVDVSEFEKLSREMRFARGVGLPGRVWASGTAAWISDVQRDDNFPRRPAAAHAGLHGAFGFPVIRRGEVLGVLEFFTREVRPSDDDLLALM